MRLTNLIRKSSAPILNRFVMKFSSKQYKPSCYYNWNDPSSYVQAIKDEYILNDLMEGYEIMKKQAAKYYNEQQLAFIMYLCILFPEHQNQLLSDFMPSFRYHQSKENAQIRNPLYIYCVKSYCANERGTGQSSRAQMTEYMKRRLFHPKNRESLRTLYANICTNCFESMGDLSELMEALKKHWFSEMEQKNFDISRSEINLGIGTYQKLILYDSSLKERPFFSDLPSNFEKDERALQNLLQILPQVLNINFVSFTSLADIKNLNKRISKCSHFQSKTTKKLLRTYSEHLVIVDCVPAINFNNLLETI